MLQHRHLLLDQTLPDDEVLRDPFAQCIGHLVGDISSIALMNNDPSTSCMTDRLDISQEV
jgi:hypothetical protein